MTLLRSDITSIVLFVVSSCFPARLLTILLLSRVKMQREMWGRLYRRLQRRKFAENEQIVNGFERNNPHSFLIVELFGCFCSSVQELFCFLLWYELTFPK